MKLEGSYTLGASRARVYALLTDPSVLARTLPGCEELQAAGPDRFEVKMKLGLGAVGGSYQGTVRLSERRPPEHLRLTLASRGPWGFADGDGALTLTEQGGQTTIQYAGELKVGGMIASIGSRLLDGAARLALSQFFANLEKEAAPGGSHGQKPVG